ncbi:MAG: hypothetical protein OFPI_18710 [Osedax symbiont Rs2]|nr:MAG: hypothetical protein OFPI_18710 [Osedax symbiont Rs2]
MVFKLKKIEKQGLIGIVTCSLSAFSIHIDKTSAVAENSAGLVTATTGKV